MYPQLDPFLQLTQLSSAQSTGCLEIRYGSVLWKVFLRFGALLSVDCSVQSLGQLIHRLRQMGCEEAANDLKIKCQGEQSLSINDWIQQERERPVHQKLVKPEQLHQISLELTKEGLESLLWLTSGEQTWHPNQMLTDISGHLLSNLSLVSLLGYYQKRLDMWQKIGMIFQSPHQRPYLTTEKLLEKPVPGGTLSPTAISQIAKLLRGISLRELALLLKQDELKLAQLLVPYIQHNLIVVREPAAPYNELPLTSVPSVEKRNTSTSPSQSVVYQIACIDDSPLILDEIERFLGNQSKYQLTRYEEPIKASSSILRLKPDLILMDITMPNINGYKLCSLFRSSEALAQTPIIMVTGNKGMVDQVRAKLVGATDYLTKPFTKEKLLEIVEKYLS